MFYEEKLINGVWNFRTSIDAEYKPYTFEELTERYDALKKENGELFKEAESAHKTLQSISFSM